MLTDAAIKALKPREKSYKVTDRDGMYLLVMPSGAMTFRFDYRLILLCHKFVCCVLCGALAARAAGQGAGDCAGDGDPDGCDRIWHVTLRSDRGIRGVDNLRVGDILR